MDYFTTDLYEIKREIVNFSHYLSEGLPKADQKFILDMQYGFAKKSKCAVK